MAVFFEINGTVLKIIYIFVLIKLEKTATLPPNLKKRLFF